MTNEESNLEEEWGHWQLSNSFSTNGNIQMYPNDNTYYYVVPTVFTTPIYTNSGNITTSAQVMLPPMVDRPKSDVVQKVQAVIEVLEAEVDHIESDAWDLSFIERTVRDMKADAYDKIKALLDDQCED